MAGTFIAGLTRAVILCGLLALAACAESDRQAAFQRAERPQADPATEWRVYLGDAASSQSSSLAQINRDNVARLELAWQYRAGEAPAPGLRKMPCNPLVVKGVLYGVSPGLAAFALNAATGEELWRYQAASGSDGFGISAQRGLSYWEDGDERRILFAAHDEIIALDARSGRPIESFGDSGRVSLRLGLPDWARDEMVVATSPGAIYDDLLIMGSRVNEFAGSAPGHIRAFDVRSGELRWMFRTIPAAGEFGADSWPADVLETAGGANSWPGMAVDHVRGMVFVPTGSATFDFYGGDRHGDNLFANTLLALDARTGERRWHYQFVRHDVWDRDLPSPPNLVEVMRDGKPVAAVAQATKTGHVFLFDRDSGELLQPVREEPVHGKALPGERLAASQPLPESPPPFVAQAFRPSTRSPKVAADLLDYLEQLPPHQLYTAPGLENSIIYPGMDGGAEWGGLAYDRESGWLFVNANEVPYLLALTELAPDEGEGLELAYLMQCAGCHGADMAGDGVAVPSLRDLSDRISPLQAWRIVRDGQGRMPGFASTPFYARAAALAHIYLTAGVGGSVAKSDGPSDPGTGRYINAGYQRFLDMEGMPASQPPWGSLTAIDLNRGEFAWRISFGNYPAMLAAGEPGLGSENYGGPIVTGGGLLFIAATPDRLFKAYDKETGTLLWQYELPAGGFATPSTYSVDGRQYVVIAAGGGKLGDVAASDILAFALPASIAAD